MDENENPEPELKIKKKRGRKPKNSLIEKEKENGDEIGEENGDENGEEKEKKKRGRRPKIITDEEKQNLDQPRIRKRGRKPKYPIETISDIREKFRDKDKVVFSNIDEKQIINDHEYNKTQVSFGNLNITITEKPEIDRNELRNMFTSKNVTKKNKNRDLEKDLNNQECPTRLFDHNLEISSESESEVEVLDNKFKSEINVDKKCDSCSSKPDNFETIKKRNIHNLLYKFSRNLQEQNKWPEKSNLLCWWCSHGFSCMPIPCVEKYNVYTKEYNLRGIFCSWECSLSFSLENYNSSVDLYKLYISWTGNRNFNVKKAPSRFVLKAFGGYMDIEDYRKSPFVNREIFLATKNKMNYINQEILEVYTETERKKLKKLKLTRKKPLKNNINVHSQITSTDFDNECSGDEY